MGNSSYSVDSETRTLTPGQWHYFGIEAYNTIYFEMNGLEVMVENQIVRWLPPYTIPGQCFTGRRFCFRGEIGAYGITLLAEHPMEVCLVRSLDLWLMLEHYDATEEEIRAAYEWLGFPYPSP